MSFIPREETELLLGEIDTYTHNEIDKPKKQYAEQFLKDVRS